jgi:hypothetical protein
MWQTAKDVWLNWGFSHPFLSSLLAMGLGLVAWWTMGLFIYLADKSSSSAPAAVAAARPAASESPTPSVNQSVSNVSGGSTVNQAAGNITVNQGVNEETLREMLKQKSIAGMADFAAKYPNGYVIFGLAGGGRLIYESHLRDIEIQTNWDTLTLRRVGNTMLIKLPTVRMRVPEQKYTAVFNSNTVRFQFVEHKPVAMQIIPGMYFEMVDDAQEIFLLGYDMSDRQR